MYVCVAESLGMRLACPFLACLATPSLPFLGCPSLQLQEQELRQQQMQREKNYRALLETEEAAAITNVEEFDCPICITPIEAGGGVVLRGCLHQVCK